jgi:LmbE family N-acetylglucosaminyl deacetylase
MVILIVGAHPDDIEIGVGATIHKLHKLHEFHGLILTAGGLRGNAEEREKATILSAEILGFHPHFARLKDSAFVDSEAERAVSAKIKAINPEMVITHSKNEKHRDHTAAHVGTISAARRVLNVLFFEGPYTSNFIPQFYVSVREENIVAKISALSNHAKAIGTAIGYYLQDENIRLLARARPLSFGELYAEAFEVSRLIDLI